MRPVTPPRGFRSLTTRLIAWVLLACGGIFLLTAGYSNTRARRMAEELAGSEAEAEARRVVADLVGGLRRLEEATRLLATAVEMLEPSGPELEALLREFLATRPRVFGATVAFAPGEWRAGDGGFAPRVRRESARSGTLLFEDVSRGGTAYTAEDWYAQPAGAGRPAWSVPRPGGPDGSVRLVAFSSPFYGEGPEGRRLRGVVSSELTLEWLNEAAQGLADPGDSSAAASAIGGPLQGRVAIVSPEGTVLASRELRLGTPLLDQLDAAYRPDVEALLASPGLDRGLEVGVVGTGNEAQLLAATRESRTGWLITVLYPTHQVLEGVERLALVQGALVLGGLGLLAVVVVLLSRRLTRPLTALAAGAAELATGDLDAGLPAVRSRDEVGRLTLAFHEMRDSLKTYIRDLAETTRVRERIEGELRAARRIQMAMLPERVVGGAGAGYELAATLEPARHVGGDLYDHFVQEGRVFFLVGDVSGKGVPAALFMARAKMLFETIAARESDPGTILRELNRGLAAENDAGMFLTVVCGSLDPATGALRYASGGHDPPVHVTADGVAPLEVEGGPLIGLLPDAECPVNELRMAPGDSVVLSTDGVSEASDTAGDMFGIERLVGTLASLTGAGAEAITRAVFDAVRGFAGEAPQSDDITILTLRYLGRG